ncbi:hypothetical protein ARAM_007572 [Aspergillus rambellii]|uniref:HhH-GPD domain-containing protein n=1 Tax=Aspergillus rambellii TaxID=308745 RepID=A0A0F8UP62_9EURO|nr:hypothetical protein ARAM_007572 [Aspergillus rambellii]
MALRRSARLSAVLPLQPSIQPAKPNRSPSQRSNSNGVTKSRKPSAKETQKRKKTLNPNSLPQPLLSPHQTATTPTSDTPQAPAPNSTTYWDSPSPPPPPPPPPPPLPQDNIGNRPQTPPPPLDRPVEPHRTNATLLTPHGSSLVAYPPDALDWDIIIPPSKTGLPRPTATTGTLLEQATAHLIATDARLEPIIRQHPCKLFSPQGLAEKIDPFRSLVSTIIGQQVSGAAAKSIKDRFVGLLYGINNRNRNRNPNDGITINNGGSGSGSGSETTIIPPPPPPPPPPPADYFPTPEEIVKCDIPLLRTAGLSQRKAEYIQGLSEKFANGELSARMLLSASDDELLEKLTAVRGLGRWSVEMFACFTLKRTDVFSTGDLGVQ